MIKAAFDASRFYYERSFLLIAIKIQKPEGAEVEPGRGTLNACWVLAIMRRVAPQCISLHVRSCPLCGAGCGNWKIFSCLPGDRRRRRHAWSATEKPSISGRRCKRLAPARREGKHFANGAAASLFLQMAPQRRFTYSSTATSGTARLINQTTAKIDRSWPLPGALIRRVWQLYLCVRSWSLRRWFSTES